MCTKMYMAQITVVPHPKKNLLLPLESGFLVKKVVVTVNIVVTL